MLPMLNTVEVEVNSRCNRRCDYCPVSILPLPSVPIYMSDQVFERLLNELKQINFTGRISYHFYNEPLLRRDLERLIERASARLPDVHQVLFTNGDLLTDERYASLRQAGAKYIVITSHDNTPHPERPFQIVQFSGNLELTNRGGIMTHLPKVTAEILRKPCYAPSEMLIVTVTGDIVLCYEDAKRQHVMGNILENSLEEIWFSEKFVRVRDSLSQGQRTEASSMCQECTNQAHIIAVMSSHSEPFWKSVDIKF